MVLKTSMNTTISSYNNCAESYADKFMDYAPYVKKMEYFQSRYIASGSSILDLGCGPGNNVKLLLQNDPDLRITGVDLSGEMIKLAKRNAPLASFQQVDLAEYQVTKMYDIVIASFCIVHLASEITKRLLQVIGAALRPGGHLYISFMEGREAGYETTSFSKKEIFFQYHDRKEILQLFDKNGISALKILEDSYPEENGEFTTDVFMIGEKHMIPSF